MASRLAPFSAGMLAAGAGATWEWRNAEARLSCLSGNLSDSLAGQRSLVGDIRELRSGRGGYSLLSREVAEAAALGSSLSSDARRGQGQRSRLLGAIIMSQQYCYLEQRTTALEYLPRPAEMEKGQRNDSETKRQPEYKKGKKTSHGFRIGKVKTKFSAKAKAKDSDQDDEDDEKP